MNKIIDTNIHQIDKQLFLEEMTPVQAENLCAGYCQSLQSYPDTYTNDISEIINQSKKQTQGVDNKHSNQKINTIDNSKKTYLNGVEIPRKGKTVVISF
jgi:hypothetical protein